MPKNRYLNSQAKPIKHHFGLQKMKTALVLVSSLLLVIFLAYACSGLLTVTEFSWGALFGNDDVNFGEEKQFAVVMNKYTNQQDAVQQAELFALQGAGANVWQVNDWYYVMGNSYPTSDDAQSVINNITTTNPDVFVYAYSIAKVRLKCESLNAEQKKVVSRALNYLKEITDLLYGYTLALDEKSLTPTTVSSLVNSLKSEVVILSNQLDVLHTVVVLPETLLIKNTYLTVTEVLNELILKLISDDQNNHTMKYSFMQVLQVRVQLHQNLQSF